MTVSQVSKPKSQKVAAVLAFAGMLVPGLHKFYLGQPGWGVAYLLLCWTPIPRFASIAEGLWYLIQGQNNFDRNFNGTKTLQSSSPVSNPPIDPAQVEAIAEALRQLDQLRQDGLLSEYEFEQKRRVLLDRIG